MPVSLQSADQFLNFAMSMIAMQFTKKSFMQEPQIIFYLRIGFAISIFLQIILALIIRNRIIRTNDQRKFKMKPEQSFLSGTEVQEETEISHFDYDLNETNKLIRGCLLQGVIIAIIHYKWKVTQPMVIQVITILKNLVFNCLYRAHLYGMTIYRPFELNMLFQTTATPKAETVVQEQENKKMKEE